MKISHEKPPNFETLQKVFGFDWDKNISTYGDTIYCQFDLPDHLIVHEETHLKQQGYSEECARVWWERYIADPKFRLDQEVEAYGNQYVFFKKEYPARYHAELLHKIGTALSSNLYGGIVNYREAVTLMKNYAKKS
jgi:hypothetical protein